MKFVKDFEFDTELCISENEYNIVDDDNMEDIKYTQNMKHIESAEDMEDDYYCEQCVNFDIGEALARSNPINKKKFPTILPPCSNSQYIPSFIILSKNNVKKAPTVSIKPFNRPNPTTANKIDVPVRFTQKKYGFEDTHNTMQIWAELC